MSAPQLPVFSVSEFVSAISAYLEQGLAMVAVQGEVTGFNVSREKLIFFELKDAKSRFSCFMMKWDMRMPIENGMEVKIIGTPKLFQTSGKFHVRVAEVELVGAGALQRAYEILKKKLGDEGLFAPERKRALPQFPEHVGVVTSEGAAAWTDVQRVIKNRWPMARITLAHVGVQGTSAIAEIAGGIRLLNAHAHAPDVLIVTRGGGSLEDLQAFNSEDVVRAIFATLADFVADVRAATPSNAAELATPDRQEVVRQIGTIKNTLERLVVQHITTLRQRIDVRTVLHVFRDALQRSRDKLIAHERLLGTLSPLATLKRGYSITRKKGNIIRSATVCPSGERITTQFHDGSIESIIV
jgi:exodeoxyribonuclease VII large subunit